MLKNSILVLICRHEFLHRRLKRLKCVEAIFLAVFPWKKSRQLPCSETLVNIYHTTRYYNSRDSNLPGIKVHRKAAGKSIIWRKYTSCILMPFVYLPTLLKCVFGNKYNFIRLKHSVRSRPDF
jgi:hypothetical protein